MLFQGPVVLLANLAAKVTTTSFRLDQTLALIMAHFDQAISQLVNCCTTQSVIKCVCTHLNCLSVTTSMLLSPGWAVTLEPGFLSLQR